MRCSGVGWDCQCGRMIKFSGNEIRWIIISCRAGQGESSCCGDNVDHRRANIKEDIKEGEYDVNQMGNDAISNPWNSPLGKTRPHLLRPHYLTVIIFHHRRPVHEDGLGVPFCYFTPKMKATE